MKRTSRNEARSTQRWRLLEAMSASVGKHGYVRTSVAHVIAEAGVSRKTFYEHFEEKEDCFLAAYNAMSERLLRALMLEGADITNAEQRSAAQVRLYLSVLAADTAMARAFVVEVLLAGPRSLARREKVNRRFAELVFGHASADPLIRKAIIGGLNDVVAGELMSGGRHLLALHKPLTEFVRRASRSIKG